MSQRNLYIVDNATESQSVKHYLSEWCSVSKQMDIATGYLEVGGLLSLDGEWQKLDKIRIILGNEMTKRTKDVIDAAVRALINRLKESVDHEHEHNEFLVGVPAILHALKTKKIECRVIDKDKFHAKAYITYFRDDYRSQFISAMNIPSGYALVGSSNFTKAGLTQNIELNVQIRDDVEQLQNWFDCRWETGVDITEAVLQVIENHCREYSPYDVYMRSMYEYFKGREGTVTEWENNDSVVFRMLSQYQKDGYNSLVEIANRYSGAFLCDGVGLGKTYVGMMLIERFVKRERKNVVLIVPAAARVSVWETTIKKMIPEILEGFYPFKIINHTDLLLEKNTNLMEQIADQAEVVIIDEAHHFRNRSSRSYRKLFDMMGRGAKKQMFMLTATPINNSFLDLQHLIELFSQRKENYFADAPLGIHSLPGHFKKMEAKLSALTEASVSDSTDATNDIFRADPLVNQLVVQRSRAYVRESLSHEEGARVLFSKRQPPIVANFSLKKGYGRLIDDFVDSFYRKDKNGKTMPILALAVYSPYEDIYFIGDKSKIDEMVSGRQAQVVNLIRQLLLKRFESSIAAFEETCIPSTNPLLRDLLIECSQSVHGIDYDEFQLGELAYILRCADIESILADFNRQTGQGREDPIVYFYEQFLDIYEKEQKKRRGVYFTPTPVVDFIVSAVRNILGDQFKCTNGFMDSSVVLLDPATGTGTFLRRIILETYERFKATYTGSHLQQEWNTYVASSLLKRIYGFEFMMAPYAVAHMKLALTLKETGYDFSDDQRLQVFLANSLEHHQMLTQTTSSDPLVKETAYAAAVSSSKINIILGNPPYRTDSVNQGVWIMSLMEDYKKEPGTNDRLRERNPKVVNDDYVKFVRLASEILKEKEDAIVAYVIPHSYSDNLTFRGMRWKLLETYDLIYILDLHGNAMSNEHSNTEERDENVFDIQQGISISFFVKKKQAEQKKLGKVFFAEYFGSRETKYDLLRRSSFGSIRWKEVQPVAPDYFFRPKDISNLDKYSSGIALNELFPHSLVGIKTADDENLISFNPYDTGFDQLIDYRPFDIRHINYDRAKVERDRYDVVKHFIGHQNWGLVINRQVLTDNWSHIQIVRNMIDNRTHYNRRGNPYECPIMTNSAVRGMAWFPLRG